MLEKSEFEKALKERIEKGWTEEEQHKEMTKTLKPEVENLQKETGYQVKCDS